MAEDCEVSEPLRRVSAALQREDWDQIVQMAKDPATVEAVTTAKVGWGGGTALHMATYCHKLEISKVLLMAGAVLTSRDKEGYTPLHIAALSGSSDVAEFLLNKGADVTTRNNYGWTPLHAAAVNGQVGVAETLLRFGADPLAKAKDGRVPLDISEAKGHTVMSQLLSQTQSQNARGSRIKRRILVGNDEDADEEKEIERKLSKLKRVKQPVSRHRNLNLAIEDEPSDGDIDDDKDSDFKPDTAALEVEEDDDTDLPRQDASNKQRSHVNALPVLSATPEARYKSYPNPGKTSSPQRVLRSTGVVSAGPGPASKQKSDGVVRPAQGEVALAAEHVAKNQRGVAAGNPSRQLPSGTAPAPNLAIQQRWTTSDIGRLPVSHVANLLTKFVTEGHDEATKQVFREKVIRGVFAFKLTGRVLIASEPTPSELARTILLGERSIVDESSTRTVDHDVLFYSITEFIRVARALRIPSQCIYPSSSATPQAQGGVRPRPNGSPMT